MVNWFAPSEDHERMGYFVAHPEPDGTILITDFVPAGSMAMDATPFAMDTDASESQTTSIFLDLNISPDEARALGVDLSVQRGLMPERTLKGSEEFAITAHSHHRALHRRYPNGPSEKDQRVVQGVNFVYSIASENGFFFNRSDSQPYQSRRKTSREKHRSLMTL